MKTLLAPRRSLTTFSELYPGWTLELVDMMAKFTYTTCSTVLPERVLERGLNECLGVSNVCVQLRLLAKGMPKVGCSCLGNSIFVLSPKADQAYRDNSGILNGNRIGNHFANLSLTV